MKYSELVDLLQNVIMNTSEFSLSQLWEYKFCDTGETHVDAFVLLFRALFVC